MACNDYGAAEAPVYLKSDVKSILNFCKRMHGVEQFDVSLAELDAVFAAAEHLIGVDVDVDAAAVLRVAVVLHRRSTAAECRHDRTTPRLMAGKVNVRTRLTQAFSRCRLWLTEPAMKMCMLQKRRLECVNELHLESLKVV